MNIPKISPINILSDLANNNDSLVPMLVKDSISNSAIVHTYSKEGGIDDAREKAIEEFGTGTVWLLGIPTIKKIMDKFIYPKFGLNPELDVKLLNKKDYIENTNKALENVSEESPLFKEKQLFEKLTDSNLVKKYKNMDLIKFAIPTIASALALSAIIRYKQKSTQKRIEKELSKNKNKINNNQNVLLENSINKNPNFTAFNKAAKKNISFTGTGNMKDLFMYNPIANTFLLDGVITTTRLAKARKGERKEVALKEGFQLFFIYALAKPLQKGFEWIGNKFNCPIELDPKILFDKNIKDKISNAAEEIKNIQDKPDIIQELHNIAENTSTDVLDKNKNVLTSVKSSLIDLLEKNGAISTIKDKDGNNLAISYLKDADETKVKDTFKQIADLNNNIKNLSLIKAYKVFAVIANVGIAILAMGILQPKLNIWMRKVLNNGDKRNPAIVAQEKEMLEKSKLQTTQG